MKRPMRKHRWYHDRDVVECVCAFAVMLAVLAGMLWREWRATDTSRTPSTSYQLKEGP